MSSYFDAAASKLERLLEAKRPYAEHRAVLVAALDRYDEYLRWVETQLRPPDRAQLERFTKAVAGLRERVGSVDGLVPRHESDAVMWIGEHLQDLHEVAHRLGSARLIRRDGAPVHDNPYWEGHTDRPE